MDNTNSIVSICDEYHSTWIELTTTKTQLIRLNELESKINLDRYKSLYDDFTSNIKEFEARFNNLKEQLLSNVEVLIKKAQQIKDEIETYKKNLNDSELLHENKIIDELQFTKEKTLNVKKQQKLTEELDSVEQTINKIQLALGHPDPEEEAKEIAKQEAKKKAEKEEAIRKQQKDEEEKQRKKEDIALQIKLATDKIQKEFGEKIKQVEKEKENIALSNTKLNQLLEASQEQLENVRIDLDKSVRENEEYKEKINNFSKQKKFDINCGNRECLGKISYEGICSKCGHDFKSGELIWKLNNDIATFDNQYLNLKRKYFFIFGFLILVSSFIYLFSISFNNNYFMISVSILFGLAFYRYSFLKKKVFALINESKEKLRTLEKKEWIR